MKYWRRYLHFLAQWAAWLPASWLAFGSCLALLLLLWQLMRGAAGIVMLWPALLLLWLLLALLLQQLFHHAPSPRPPKGWLVLLRWRLLQALRQLLALLFLLLLLASLFWSLKLLSVILRAF